jgi:hypothetical protein
VKRPVVGGPSCKGLVGWASKHGLRIEPRGQHPCVGAQLSRPFSIGHQLSSFSNATPWGGGGLSPTGLVFNTPCGKQLILKGLFCSHSEESVILYFSTLYIHFPTIRTVDKKLLDQIFRVGKLRLM